MGVVVEDPGLERVRCLPESTGYHVVPYLKPGYSRCLYIHFAPETVLVITAARQQQEHILQSSSRVCGCFVRIANRHLHIARRVVREGKSGVMAPCIQNIHRPW